jgi:hypothetical protein
VFIPRSGGKPRVIPKPGRMKSYAVKLCSEGSLRPLQMNLLILIVYLVVMSENICSRTTPARSNSASKLVDLNDDIRHQLMQLHLKFVKNIQKNKVRRYTVTSGKEILKYNRLVFSRIWNRLCARRSSESFQKVESETLESYNTGLRHGRLPEIIAHVGKSSLRLNFHVSTAVGGIFATAGAIRRILSVRSNTLLRNSLSRDNNLLVTKRCFRLFS